MFINYKEGLDHSSDGTSVSGDNSNGADSTNSDASPNGDNSNGDDSNGDASTETDTSSSNENSTDNPSSKADAESIKQAMNFDAMPAGSIMSNASAAQTGAMTNIMLGSSEVPGANKSTGSSVKAGGASTLGGFNVCLAVSPLDPNDKNQVPPTSGPSETETMSNEAVESPLDTILEQGNSTSGNSQDDKEDTSSSASNVNSTCSFGTYYNSNLNSCAKCAGKWEPGIESCITNDDYWVLGIISMSADASGCNILPSNTYFATKKLVIDYGVQTQTEAQSINDNNISLGKYNNGWTFTDISSSDVREAAQVNWSVDPVPTNYASQKSSDTNIAPLEGCDVSTRNKKWVVAKAGKSVTKGDNGYPELKDNNSGWEWVNGSVSLLPVEELTKSWEKPDSTSSDEGETTPETQ